MRNTFDMKLYIILSGVIQLADGCVKIVTLGNVYTKWSFEFACWKMESTDTIVLRFRKWLGVMGKGANYAIKH